MRLDDDALLYMYWDAVLTFDPTGSTVVLEVDGVQKPASWLGSPVTTGTGAAQKWTQTARTTNRFGGTSVTVGGSDMQMTAGRHLAQWLINPTSDGQHVPGTSFAIDA